MSNPTISIRLATIKDLDEILSLNKSLFEYERQFNETYNHDWPFSKQGKDYFFNRLTKESGIVIVAEIENKIIGYACGVLDTYSFRSINPIVELENMFVMEQYRSQGFGKLLVERFITETAGKGAKRLKIGTLFHNTEAIKFYKNLGLVESELYLEKNI